MQRWQKHWWEWTQRTKPVVDEPTVWVDPSLVIDQPAPHRFARGTTPPPTYVGAYCALEPLDSEGMPTED